MHQKERSEDVCQCGHGRYAHEHYRAGTECSECLCPLYRPVGPASSFRRVLALLLRRR